MWTSTRFSIIFFLFFLLQLNLKGQADAAGHSEPCCESKSVGNYNYTLSKKGSTPTICPRDCIYTRDNEGEANEYCFAPGKEHVYCNNRGYAEITNHCGATAEGAVYPKDYNPIVYTVGPNNTVYVKPISEVFEVAARVSFPGGNPPPPTILFCDYQKTPSEPWAWKFSIACKDGGSEKCLVHAVPPMYQGTPK